MRRRSDAKGTAVELLSVPTYGQGTFDSLCAYYTGAMMLATLVPDYAVEFGRATSKAVKSMSRDPLFRQYGNNEDNRTVVARWFHHGETIENVVKILNRNMRYDGLSTRFECHHMNHHDGTFDRIARSVDAGLPVMLGWDTEDYGCHAVLATGYWIGKEKWLAINDPGGSQEISWHSLKAQQKDRGNFEVGCVSEHRGPRPMKSVTEDKKAVVYQWTPAQEYKRVEDLFAAAGWNGLQRPPVQI